MAALLSQVTDAERARERERRHLARAKKAAAAQAEHELRVTRALERAAGERRIVSVIIRQTVAALC
jgi:hypothetical protein